MAREMSKKQQANFTRVRKQVPANLVRRKQGVHATKRERYDNNDWKQEVAHYGGS